MFLVMRADPAPAPIIIGNGSDPRTFHWSNAKVTAVNRIHKIQQFLRVINQDTETPVLVREFLVGEGLLQLLKEDIFNARHLYDTDPHAIIPDLCALTNVPPAQDDVRIFLPACMPLIRQFGAPYAVRTLVHESTHHLLRDPAIRDQFGIVFSGDDLARYAQEEEFCDAVAGALERAFDRIADTGVHFWRDVSVEHGLPERGFHSAVWTGDDVPGGVARKMLVWGGCKASRSSIYGCSEYLKSGAIYDPARDTAGENPWQRMTEDGAPEERAYHQAVWTGSSQALPGRMVVFGGCSRGDYCSRYLNDGSVYDPTSDSWDPLPPQRWADFPPRAFHSLIWTGDKIVVFGGETAEPRTAPRPLGDGAQYDPASKTWKVFRAPAEALVPRSHHTAIWTGDTGHSQSANRMLVFGGCDVEVYNDACGQYYNDGAFYDPETGDWTALKAAGVPPSPRRLHSALHVNTADADGHPRNMLVIWGGERDGNLLSDGATLDLRTMRWLPLSSLGPGPRARHSAVWTGDGMLVFGGLSARNTYATELSFYTLPSEGARTGRWKAVPVDFYPLRAQNHTALWTGDEMLVWGGQTDRVVFQNVGAAFRFGSLLQ